MLQRFPLSAHFQSVRGKRGGPVFRNRMPAWLRWILVRLRRQFLLVCLCSIDLVGRPAGEGGVGSLCIVVTDPTSDPRSCLAAGLKGIEVDAFVFQRSPQPLD